MGKNTKILSQDSQSPGWHLNPGPLKYKAGVLTTWLRRSVSLCVIKYTMNMNDRLKIWLRIVSFKFRALCPRIKSLCYAYSLGHWAEIWERPWAGL
jgi:hypothetical protein